MFFPYILDTYWFLFGTLAFIDSVLKEYYKGYKEDDSLQVQIYMQRAILGVCNNLRQAVQQMQFRCALYEEDPENLVFNMSTLKVAVSMCNKETKGGKTCEARRQMVDVMLEAGESVVQEVDDDESGDDCADVD